MRKSLFVIIGLTLLALYIAQEVFDWKIEIVEVWQHKESYRRWSGLALSLVILFQWTLSLVRSKEKWQELSLTFKSIHNWIGAFTPLLFYIHSSDVGFAYLFVLSITFLSNFVLGSFNLDIIKSKSQIVFQGWMILHVAASFFITFLTIYHIWIVFYYE